MSRSARFNDLERPLVSIVIQSVDDSHLRQCLESVLCQTYRNIEVCIYDCASVDDSLDIIVEYQEKFPGIITVVRLRKNYFLNGYVENLSNVRGKYFVRFESSCFLEIDFIEKCVRSLEANPSAAFVNVRKKIVGQGGEVVVEQPLYDGTYLVPGNKHLLCHLQRNSFLSSSISLFSTDRAKSVHVSIPASLLNFGDPLMSYVCEACLCVEHDLVYMDEPLFSFRGSRQQRFFSDPPCLIDLFESFSFRMNFMEGLYGVYGLEGVEGIMAEVLKELARESIAFGAKALKDGRVRDANKFMHLAHVFNTDFGHGPSVHELEMFFGVKAADEASGGECLNYSGELYGNMKTFSTPSESKKIEF